MFVAWRDSDNWPGTSQKREVKWTSVRKSFEMGTKSSVFTALPLRLMEFISAARLFEELAVTYVSLSFKRGELNWCGCLCRAAEDSGGGNANDLYGQ